MPIPILLQREKEQIENNNHIDYSFLAEHMPLEKEAKKVFASNDDAAILFELWRQGKTNENGTINIASYNAQDIIRLKTRGLVTADSTSKDTVSFTPRGKQVLVTMVLGEQNNYQKDTKNKNYHEILAEMSKRGKKGYRTPRFASNNSNSLRI